MKDFTNLRAAVIQEIMKKSEERAEALQQVADKKDLSKSEFTATRLKQWDDLTLEQLKNLLLTRYQKKANKQIKEKLQEIEIIENAPDFKDCTLTVEWTKSATWGSNPKCELKGNTSNNYEYYASERVGGCGYDKESTATANALNQFPAILKLLYSLKNDNIKISNRDLFGYGSGYGILPYFEGGVGVSTMNKICESIGCIFEHTAGGKTFDVYKIIKK